VDYNQEMLDDQSRGPMNRRVEGRMIRVEESKILLRVLKINLTGLSLQGS
jgi:hypothetical protein